MSDVVVPIRKGVTPEPIPGTVNESVVDELQGLLDKAKAGEITGVAYVSLHPGDLTCFGRAGRMTRGVIGAIELLKYDMCRDED